MLAGPKRRQKVSVDPRNKQWINDPNQFGRRLMEKMGWTNGKGLGVKEDGDVENVKVTLKGNTKGLGFTKNEGDNWLAHQDDFNDLLSQLHQEHTEGDVITDAAPKSIEEKSKSSRKRVHYKKFTQGKDLANRSVDDMNCILGKRSASSTPQNLSAPNSDTESEGAVKLSHGVVTIVNPVSVHDYFAKKMASMKASKTNGGDMNLTKGGDVPNDDIIDGDVPNDDIIDGDEEQAPKRKKKRMKEREAGRKKRNVKKDELAGSEEDMVGFVGFRTGTDVDGKLNIDEDEDRKDEDTQEMDKGDVRTKDVGRDGDEIEIQEQNKRRKKKKKNGKKKRLGFSEALIV